MESSSMPDLSQTSLASPARRKTNNRNQVTLDNTLTKIFAASKHILTALPKWADGQVDRDAVQGLYSVLNIHCRLGFRMIEGAGLDVSTLKPSPERIETLITAALNEQPPSPQALEKHMVYIKESVVKLLTGLRTKQAEYNAIQKSAEAASETPTESTPQPPSPKPPPSAPSSSAREETELRYSDRSPVANENNVTMPHPTNPPQPPRIDTSLRQPSPDRMAPITSPVPSPAHLSLESAKSATTQAEMKLRSPIRSIATRDASNASNVPVNLKSLRRLSFNAGHSSHFDDNSETGADTTRTSETSKEDHGGTITIPNLFLQVNHHIKKVTYTGPTQPSFAALQMLFMEKGGYTPGQEDFPVIYIRDPVYGVWHLLEDCAQIKDGTELRLQMEDPTEVIRRQLDTSLCVLTKEVRELKRSVAENNDAIKRSGMIKSSSAVRQGDENPLSLGSRPASMQSLSVSQRLNLPMPSSPLGSNNHSPFVRSDGTASGVSSEIMVDRKEAARMEIAVQTMRKDLGIARQQVSEFNMDATASLADLGTKMRSFIETTVEKHAHVQSASEKSRAMITDGKRRMATSTEKLLVQMQDLQESIETLRLDVVSRKSKPTTSRMLFVEKELAEARKESGEFLNFIEINRPVWKHTWEEELKNILDEQKYLGETEILAEDFVQDTAALEDLFAQLKQVITLQRNSMVSSSPSSPGTSIFVPPPPDPSHEGHTSVLQELASVPVDSSRRLRAMEKADKLRRKEQEARKNQVIGEAMEGDDVELEFEQELRGFVGQRKLRKTGGTQEVERMRQKRNDEALKKMGTVDGDPNKIIVSSNN